MAGSGRRVQVAARCLETAVQGAGHNVDINLKDITVTGVRKLFLILALPPPGLGLQGWPGRGRQEGGGEGGEGEGQGARPPGHQGQLGHHLATSWPPGHQGQLGHLMATRVS